jgi:hypothetical protein
MKLTGFTFQDFDEEPKLFVYRTEEEAKTYLGIAKFIACGESKRDLQDVIDACSFIVPNVGDISNQTYMATEGEVKVINQTPVIRKTKEQNEKEKREFDVKYKKAERLAKKYATDLVKNKKLEITDDHLTNLKYDLEHEEEHDRVIKTLARELVWNFFDRDTIGNKDVVHIEGGKCGACGHSVYYRLDGNKLYPEELDTSGGHVMNWKWKPAKKSCMKIEPYSIEFTVPSGNLIVVSWTENGGKVILPCIDENEKYLDINAHKGKVDTSKLYAEKLYMAHFFVGNNSPSVYLSHSKDLLHVGRDGYIDEDDKEVCLMSEEQGKDVGSICTDLWWSTAFDYETYKAMCIKALGEEEGLRIAEEDCSSEEYGVVNIQVKPGRYKCTHYYGTKEVDRGEYKKPQLYTKYEWIGAE